MKKLYPFIAASLFSLQPLNSKAQDTFQKTYGGDSATYFRSVELTNDGGYIMVGATKSFGAGNFDVYLVKTDMNGDTLWTRTYGGTDEDIGYSVKQTTDSGYIITGSTVSFGPGNGRSDAYLIRTDRYGDTLWTRSYSTGLGTEIGYSILQTIDGGYAFAGATTHPLYGNLCFVSKTDSSGIILWSREYGGVGLTIASIQSLLQTQDGKYVAFGSFFSGTGGSEYLFIMKTDTDGSNSSYPALMDTAYFNNQYGQDGVMKANGDYALTGYTTHYSAGGFDVCLEIMNSTSDTILIKTYGGSGDDRGYSIQQTSDGGFIIAGSTTSFASVALNVYNVYLIKTNTNGDTLWTRTFGPFGNSEAYSVKQTADGGYIVAGYTTGLTSPSQGYLIKTDANGNSGCNENKPATITDFSGVRSPFPYHIPSNTANADFPLSSSAVLGSGGIVASLCSTVGINENNGSEFSILTSPNPFTNTLSLSGTKAKGEAVLYDVMGKEMLRQKTTEGETRLNTSHLAAGFYMLSYTIGEKRENVKVVKN